MLFCPLFAWGQHFSYPIPPDTISTRQARINYMTAHFWNEQTIADTVNFQSPKLLLDYLYLLKQSEATDRHIQTFITLSCQHESTFGLILYWLDQILYDASSRHYDEPLYSALMQAVISSDADSVMKLIPRQRLKIMRQNQVGKQANDFSFVDKEGRPHRLYEVETPLLVLIFTNPGCSLCQQMQERIGQNETLQKQLESGQLKVLSVTPDADEDEWKQHAYPTNWMVGFDSKKTIYSQQLYDIQRLPCIYLLDKDKHVLLKEADDTGLYRYLSTYKRK